MGDFAGGTLKYLRTHPIERVTIAGGFAKLAKLAAGHLDLHSRAAGSISQRWRTGWLPSEPIRPPCRRRAKPRALARCSRWRAEKREALARDVARRAREVALATLSGETSNRGRNRRSRWRLYGAGGLLMAKRLLILGGTTEAAALARAAIARFGDDVAVTTSLAGRTERPGPIPGQVRIGGFGGATGLAAYLQEHAIDCLIDATHPFAAAMSAEARAACELANVPRLMLLRPPWRRHPLDRWIEVDDMAAAAGVVARIGWRAWLTIGAGEDRGLFGSDRCPISGSAGRPAAPALAAALLRGRRRTRAVYARRRTAFDCAPRDQCARVQGERRRRDRSQTRSPPASSACLSLWCAVPRPSRAMRCKLWSRRSTGWNIRTGFRYR